jgi:streptomycin 6-kinase
MNDVELWIERWNLTLDGEMIRSNWGILAPMRYLGAPAMLKIALDIDEEKGGQLMAWWDGIGAARVYELVGTAMIMERLTGERSLAAMVKAGEDDEATRILCDVAARLHAPRDKPRPALTELDTWFSALWKAAPERGGALAHAAVIARQLLDTEQDRVVLHGDLHHNNVLDGGARGWLAIDPKFLYGERAFDFVNILRNPDIATSLIPGRFARQVDVIVEAAKLDRERFLQWTVAFTGLSAAWFYADNVEPESDLALNALAVDLLG